MFKFGVMIWSQWEHGGLTDNLQIIDQGVDVWEEQVLGKEFMSVSSLVTQLEETAAVAVKAPSSVLRHCSFLNSLHSVSLLSLIRTPFGPLISEDYLGGRSLVTD